MKTNKVPEKIYLERILCSNEVYDNWKSQRTISNDIEYVRKDAFIEKALKFIKTNIDRIVNNQHGVCMGCMDVEFRKYMQGEKV